MSTIQSNGSKNILLIAFHYPPYNAGSGMLRTLKFSKYLPHFGWNPTILTVDIKAYETFDRNFLDRYEDTEKVIRCFCLDTSRHLAIRGRYPALLACPDNYASWIISGFMKGISVVKRKQIDVIFSTFPIPTAHVLGYLISRYTRKPWVADFRDPMVQPEQDFPKGKFKRYIWESIEKKTVQRAQYILFTTESARDYYRNRYNKLSKNRFKIIQNGFDEDDISNISFKHVYNNSRKVKIVHCGLIYPEERDPTPFFKSLRLIKDRKIICSDIFTIELYGSGDSIIEERYKKIIDDLYINDMVVIKPRIRYEEILKVMLESDILLLFQGEGCDYQVPAKLYEYFSIGKPILALTSKDSESGRLVKENNAGLVVHHKNIEETAENLENMVLSIKQGKALPAINKRDAQKYSRRQQAADLASILNALQ